MNHTPKHWLRSALSLLLVLCLMGSVSIAALADTSNTICDGEEAAEATVAQAVKYCDLAQQIIDLIVEKVIDNDTVRLVFKGSDTSDDLKGAAISLIEDEITDDMIQRVGLEVNDANRTMLAEEVYYVACIYYDTLEELGDTPANREVANEKCMKEILRFALVTVDHASEAEALETADFYMEINEIYKSEGEAAAVAFAATEVGTPHSYGTPEWTWAEDYSTASAAFTCSTCEHAQTVNATITKTTTNATCTEDGATIYTATAVLDDVTATDTKSVSIEATGHTYGEPAWTWAEDYTTARLNKTCSKCKDVISVDAVVTKETVAATCTEDGMTTYTAKATMDEEEYTDVKTVALPGGHVFGEPVWTWAEDYSTASVAITCTVCEEETKTAEATVSSKVTEINCQKGNTVTHTAVAELNGKSYTDTKTQTVEGTHNYEDSVCTICGDIAIARVSGKGRCETAIAVADAMKETLGVEKFSTIIIANGDNFADALAGTYLASKKEAPILLYRASAMELNLEYIQENLTKDGVVYLLGGTAAVPADVATSLTDAGIAVKRLSGRTRFDTNLAILEEAGIEADQEILVCTGYNFADSLSASATGLPMLLVNNTSGELTENQVAFLETLTKTNSLCIIGGSGAVSTDLAAALSKFATTERISGKTRYETSILVAGRYFDAPEAVILAYAQNFPDGLCGGVLAHAMNAPLVLTDANGVAVAADYVAEGKIGRGIVLGGASIISDATVRTVFALDADTVIPVK